MSFIQKLKKYFYTKFNKEYKALYEQANEFHKSGNYKEAIRLYDKMISLYPNKNEPYLGKGSILSMWGEKQEAIQIYKKLIMLNPNCAKAYESIGNILNDGFLEEYEEAISFYDKAIALETKNIQVYWAKAEALNALDDKQEELVKVVDKAVKLDRKKQYLDGDILFEIGKYDLAILAFSNSIKKYPSLILIMLIFIIK